MVTGGEGVVVELVPVACMLISCGIVCRLLPPRSSLVSTAVAGNTVVVVGLSQRIAAHAYG